MSKEPTGPEQPKVELKPKMNGWHYVLFDAKHLGFGEMVLGYFKFSWHAEMFAKLFDEGQATVHTIPGVPQELLDLPAKMRKFNEEQARKGKPSLLELKINKTTNNNIRVHDEVYPEDDDYYDEEERR